MGMPERFKIVRENMGLSQKDMAASIGISLPGLQGYEAGRSVPGGNVFEALVKLGFNANWLLTGEGEMKLGAEVYPLAEGLKNGNTTGERPVALERHIKRADLSPIKEAAVSYIEHMEDIHVPKVITFILSQPEISASILARRNEITGGVDYATWMINNLSPEEKQAIQEILKARGKQLRGSAVVDIPVELRPTGT
ncbi:MAG: helix-turn-helix transcriptional regulator [Deltaproteobacteria bacterium]|nr:helix-turn-helix transcriptional regulator [Deltaproteobacteria bacterium]